MIHQHSMDGCGRDQARRLDDAVAAVAVRLTAEEVQSLEALYQSHPVRAFR